MKWGIDLQTEHERYLTDEVFRKPVFVTDYPKEIKAFYMRLNDDKKTVAAADLLAPGIGEIIGGSQREEREDVLRERMEELGMRQEDYRWYLDLRRFGGVKHTGFGLGFDRIVMYITGIEQYPRCDSVSADAEDAGVLRENRKKGESGDMKQPQRERKIDTVLFDFDGTVMDTNEIILRSWEYTFERLRGEKPDRKMLLATFGEPLKMTMRDFFGGDEAEVERNIEIYRSYQRDHYLDHISLFPGIYEMLAAVKSAGFRTALVTSRLRPTTYDGVKKFDIGRFFDHIITGGRCDAP